LDIQGSEKGDWGFKALKQLVKLNVQLGNREEMLSCYKEFLGYIKTAVTRNTSEKAINSILDFVTSHAQQSELLREFYEITLLALEEANNERLWFKTNLKLGKLMFQGGQYAKLAKVRGGEARREEEEESKRERGRPRARARKG
jgi:COP9 signalosome complex subunit 2